MTLYLQELTANMESIKLKGAPVPNEVRQGRILLHCCCAPCSSAILEWMAHNDLHPCIFFSNSNIVPVDEYAHRLSELKRYAAVYGMETVDDEYDHGSWLAWVKHLEAEHGSIAEMPERGLRCLECFRFRLLRAAEYAASNGYNILTTTLASSRWKDLNQVDEAGRFACNEANAKCWEGRTKVLWWGQNWRKGGLQERRSCLIKEYDIYNQEYCGCEFSIAQDK
jgi:predicted adenine nucleotide alpha hydrolase (AANH) superfamily ATPase